MSKGSQVVIVYAALSRSVLWRQMRVLILMENMKLCIDPLSRLYAEYLLKVYNGQKSSIIDHFPLEANAKPLDGVEITLYLEIH